VHTGGTGWSVLHPRDIAHGSVASVFVKLRRAQ
jgi:hypothetical protein